VLALQDKQQQQQQQQQHSGLRHVLTAVACALRWQGQVSLFQRVEACRSQQLCA
jgi:hypothetical protein